MKTSSQPTTPVTSKDALGRARSRAIRRIVLTGYMGVGKSTIGRALATEFGWTFLDIDDLVQQATGHSIMEIFADRGEAEFRREESLALVRSLRQSDAILALGGGAPEVVTNRLLLEQTPGTCVLLLTAEFPVLYDRCMLQSLERGAIERPNLADPIAARLRYQQRMPFYRRLATITLETTSLSKAATVTAAVRLLRPLLTVDRFDAADDAPGIN